MLTINLTVDDLCYVLSQKENEVAQGVALIDNAYRKVEATEARLDATIKEVKQADMARTAWEHQYKLKAREADIQRRSHANKLVNLEREKRALVEQIQYMEARLETERVRADGAEQAKITAMQVSEGMRKHFDFYRNYYDAQAGLYGQYFSPDHSPSTTPKSNASERKATTEALGGKMADIRDGAVSKFPQDRSHLN